MEEYAGFWRRVGAYFIDAIILGIGLSIVASIFGVEMGYSAALGGATPEQIAATQGNGLFNLISIAAGVAYAAGMESSSWQATLGKKALGMVVTDVAGNRISLPRAIGRYFAKILSALILLIGFIMVAFTERKQGLHDMLAGTLVLVGKPGGAQAQVFE
jgi:uncharacterized RDD family membrane protein YckC